MGGGCLTHLEGIAWNLPTKAESLAGILTSYSVTFIACNLPDRFLKNAWILNHAN